MNDTNITGGPAFPSGLIDPSTPEDAVQSLHRGMSLREYFAAHANPALYKPLETLTAKLGRHPSVGELADYITDLRFIEADSMLKARSA